MPHSFNLSRPGPLAFPVTPMRSDGAFDVDAYREHLSWMLEHRPPALFVACGTGEFAALDTSEIGAVVRATVEVAPGDVPIYCGTGGSIAHARAIARVAEEEGAHGLLVLPPYLVTGEQDGLVAYCRALAEVSSLGLILYGRDTAVYDPETIDRLADLPSVVGYKDGLGDVERLQAIVRAAGDRLTMFNGMPTAEVFQSAFGALGVPHYSSAVFNFVPEVSWAFHRAVTSGDDTSRDALLDGFFLPLSHLRRRVRGYAVALVKAGVALRRRSAGPVRPPLVEVRPEHVTELEALIAASLEGIDAS